MTTTSFRFSKRAIDALPPHTGTTGAREAEYTDTDISGLKLCVNRKGRKSFLLRYTTPKGGKASVKLGDYGVIDVDAARKKALEFKRLLSDGIDPKDMRDQHQAMPSLQDFCHKDYLPHISKRKRSAADDVSKLETHVYAKLGKLKLSEIKSRDIQQYLSYLRNEQKLAPATANRHQALLSCIFSLALQHELIEKNPCQGVRKYQENNQRQRYLSQDELQRLLAAMDDQQVETMEKNRVAVAALKLLLLTGTRREEAMQAKWEEIDLQARLWLLPKTKSGKKRHVPLNEGACRLLESLKQVPGCPYVFVNPRTGKRLNTPVKTFQRLLDRAGITDFHIHDLRHTFASLAVNGGASLYTVQHLLGHASSQTTQRYAHLQDSTLLDASNEVAGVVQKAQARAG